MSGGEGGRGLGHNKSRTSGSLIVSRTKKKFTLQIDISGVGIASVLSQEDQDGLESQWRTISESCCRGRHGMQQ